MADIPQTLALLNLPDELIELVFTQLHPLAVVLCRQICKTLRELIDSSIELQFRIELAVDGLLVNCRGSLPAAELLNRVKATREAFESFQPPWRWRVEAPHSRRDHYEVCDGVWGRCMNRLDHEPFRSIQYDEMVAPKYNPNGRWRHQIQDIGLDITDFSYWLAADLQILMEWRNKKESRRVHFRTFFTNVIHPKAAVPFLDIHHADCAAWRYCLTLAHEEYFALLFTEFDAIENPPVRKGGAMVFNWKTGDAHLPYTDVSDLAFLDSETVLLLHDGRNGLVGISLYSLKERKVLQSLAFLKIMENAFRVRFLTHPQYGATSPAAQARLFRPDPEVEVLPIDIQLDQMRGPAFFMILSISKLKRRCRELRDAHPDLTEFDWAVWSPDVTRFLPINQLRNTGFRSTFGSRMLAIGNVSMERLHPTHPERLVLLDFNPRPIRRGAESCMRDNCRVLVISGDTLWPHTPRVMTSLPVRIFVSNRPTTYLDIHLDGSTMICRKDDCYNIYSFLPRHEFDFPDEEEQSIIPL